MSQFLILAFLIIGVIAATAEPLPSVLSRLENGYSPDIQTKVTPDGRSPLGCSTRNVQIFGQDPITRLTRLVEMKEYLPPFKQNPEQSKSVVIVPPTGGENILDRVYANSLCASGIRVSLLQSWEYDDVVELDMRMHDQGAERSLAATRHVVEYLSATNAGRKIGLLGTSVGAISGVLAVGYEARLSAGVFIVGGIGMSEIIATSTETTVAQLRTDRMQHFGFADVAAYQAALAQNVTIEPGDFVNWTGPKKVLTVIATEDTSVPTTAQYRLFEAFGRPESIVLNSDHVRAITDTSVFHQLKIVRFFNANLED